MTPPLLPAQETPTRSPADELREQIATVITHHARMHPRNLQKTLGPSEIGHPCARKLVYHIIDAPKSNPGFDVLPSEIGIGYHARLEQHFQAENTRLGWERYLTETRVQVWPGGEDDAGGLTGSCDLYDVERQRVIDFKILGDASYKWTKLHGPIISYRRQLQLYGRGFERAGYPVESVALVAIPKSGTTHGIWCHVEPYDQTVAAAMQTRWVQLLATADTLDVERHPQFMAAFEAVDEHCEFCPFLSRTPDGSGLQCPGPNEPRMPPPKQ